MNSTEPGAVATGYNFAYTVRLDHHPTGYKIVVFPGVLRDAS